MSEIQMRAIVRDVLNLPKDDCVHIMRMIKRHDSSLLIFQNDGCRVILNRLPAELITEIHNFVQYKLHT